MLTLPPPIHGSSVVAKQIVNSDVINKNFDTNFINIGTSQKVQDIGKGGKDKLLAFIRVYKNVFKALINDKFDIVYLSPAMLGKGLLKDSILVFLVRLFNSRIILHLHNKGAGLNKKYLNHLLYKNLFFKTKVILLSPYLYDDISKYVKEDEVFYCPNGIPESSVELSDKKINSIPTILFLSNLIESKGIYELLDACHIIRKKGVDFKCYVAGNEGDVSYVQLQNEILERNLGENIQICGKVEGDTKSELFSQSDIFVFPTYYPYETFGLVNLEAMQHGLPIISTFEGGIPSVISNGKTGFLIEQKNTVALADHIQELLINSDLRETMGKNGRDRFLKNFTLRIFENRLLNILKEASN